MTFQPIISAFRFIPDRIFLTVLLSMLGFRAIAQQDGPVFQVFSDAKEVVVDGYFEVTFTLRNATGSDFTPPLFQHFTVLSGPSSSSSMQIVNGQVTREVAYSYTLQPEKPGKFVIGPASIKANGKKLKTESLIIQVIQGRKQADPNDHHGEKVYVRLEPSKTEAYLGEQILLDYKLYTSVSLDGYDILEEPDFRGFFVQELKRYNFRTQREVINGKQVTTKILRRLALFPQQTGALVISPASLQLAVVEEKDSKGFFFSRNIHPVLFTTDSVIIDIQALPGDQPATFTGAVGNFDFQASVNRNMVTTDDAVSIMMLIHGNGDLKRVLPPPLLLSDSFEIYPPKIVDEKNTEEAGELFGKKVIEYLVLPRYPGTYDIRPAFSFFDTEKGVFQTLSTGPYALKVTQGSLSHPKGEAAAARPVPVEDIHFIKSGGSLEKKSSLLLKSWWLWLLFLVPLLVFVILFVAKKRQDRKTIPDSGILKQMHAKKEAERRLALAGLHLSNHSSRHFYDEISKATFGYVGDKLNIPLSELSKHNVAEKLRSLRVSEPLVQDFMSILQTSEMALFAAMDTVADMQEIYDKTVSVIAGIEEEIG